MKKVISTILAIAMCIAIATTSVAASETEREKQPTRMWDSVTYVVPAYSSVNTGSFSLTDHYFAFEMNATSVSGGTYTVAFKRNNVTMVSVTQNINSGTFKKDWITIISGTHNFTITNNSGVAITVTLTYYSWN